jgi:U3 small nucleolar RNA-associated protein MPP10
VEEIIPAAVADASLLAPEEIYSKPKGNPVAKNERTDTERRHERRLKKQKQRSKAKEREQRKKLVSRLKPGLGNKYSQEKALRDLEKASKTTGKIILIDSQDQKTKSTFRSSSAFFERLQDQVSAEIKGVSTDKKQKKQQGKKSSAKLKL